MKAARWLAVCLLLPVWAAGEELGALRVNPQLLLPAVVEAAYARSPQQRMLDAASTMARARDAQADGLLPGAPALLASHQNDVLGSGRQLVEWQAGVEIPLWLPGQRDVRQAAAQAAHSGWSAERQELKLLVAGQVRDAIWEVEMSRNAASLAQLRVSTALALQADVEKRWQAGELPRTDTLLAQNETLQARADQLQASLQLRQAEYRYQLLTGLTQLPSPPVETPATAADISDDHPLLAAQAARVALACAERDQSRAERRENPQLALLARHERGAFDQAFNSSVGFSLRIPLDAEARAAPLLAAAEMVLGQALSQHGQQRLALQVAWHAAQHSLQISREALALIETQHRLTQENLRLAQQAFALGESDLVHLLRVRAMARESALALASRRIQLNWDIARYNQALGVLP